MGNVAGEGARGGGIFCNTLSCPTITSNIIASNSGLKGAISCNVQSSPLIMWNTIAHNSGGGVYCGDSSPTVVNNTIVDNPADWVGGVFCLDASPTISGNIIAGNATAVVCDGLYSEPFIHHNDVWNNAQGDFWGCPAGVGDTNWRSNFNGTPCDSFYNIIREPSFADTVEFGLAANSPCIDAGDSNVAVNPDSGGCRIDIGARQFLYSVGDANRDAVIDIGDAVFVLNYLFKNGTMPYPYHAGDANCDGGINIADVVCLLNYLFKGGILPC